jgi:hypothetical protein
MNILSGKVSRDYFVDVAKNHIVVVYFAATIQHQYQERLCGVSFWQRLEFWRKQKFHDLYMPASAIISGESPLTYAAA